MLLIGPGDAFGAQLVAKFLSQGFRVGVIANSYRRLELLGKNPIIDKNKIEFRIADASDGNNLYKVVDSLISEWGYLDCLIYNAKISIKKNGIFTEKAELQSAIDVNIVGAQTAIRASFPYLRYNNGGSIIVTGGGFKDKPHENKFALSLSKNVIHALVRSLRGPLLRESIEIKTLVIDGVVGNKKTFEPEFIAEEFYNFYTQKTKWVHWVRKSLATDPNQPTLFDGGKDEPGGEGDSEAEPSSIQTFA